MQDSCGSCESNEYVMNCLILLSTSARFVFSFFLKRVILNRISRVFHSLPKELKSTHLNVVLLGETEKEVMVWLYVNIF